MSKSKAEIGAIAKGIVLCSDARFSTCEAVIYDYPNGNRRIVQWDKMPKKVKEKKVKPPKPPKPPKAVKITTPKNYKPYNNYEMYGGIADCGCTYHR